MKIERGDILMVNLGQVPGTSLQSIIQTCGHVSSDAMRRITRAVEIQTGVYEEGDYDSRRI